MNTYQIMNWLILGSLSAMILVRRHSNEIVDGKEDEDDEGISPKEEKAPVRFVGLQRLPRRRRKKKFKIRCTDEESRVIIDDAERRSRWRTDIDFLLWFCFCPKRLRTFGSTTSTN